MIQSGVESFLANAISASVAVTPAYFISVGRILSYVGRLRFLTLVFSLLYQAPAIAVVSWVIHLLTPQFGPMLAKVIVTPATLVANFLFMVLLTGRKPEGASGADAPAAGTERTLSSCRCTIAVQLRKADRPRDPAVQCRDQAALRGTDDRRQSQQGY